MKIKPFTKSLLFMALLVAASASLQAQRIAYVNMEEILQSMPEYQKAQEELDRLANNWRQEINQEYDKIKGMYNQYQTDQVLMSEEMRKKREDEIVAKEKAARELQKQRFGPEGDLFKRRKQLVQPIQDKLYAAIQNYATNKGYDFIFDVSSPSAGIIFTNDRYDKTEDIMEDLGMK